MRSLRAIVAALALSWACAPGMLAAATAVDAERPAFDMAPPARVTPVVVHVGFELRDINEIDDVAEQFTFSGVLTLRWNDPRRAFDPGVEGAAELVYQGAFQFNEVATGWFPQVVLANESGLYQTSGVVLRVRPDGTATLIQTVTAEAETELDMTWFPFDDHRLEIVFEVLGFSRSEVELRADPAADASILESTVRIPQWRVMGAAASIRDHGAPGAGAEDLSPAYVVSVEVDRDSFYVRRLVTFPLIIIVVLSFSVFWMDKSSLGDRLSVSFIGILTAVSYQLMMSDVLPRISYVTLMHGFLILSFVTMSATVVINLVVGTLDKRGLHARGDLIDQRCRWIFPIVYFGCIFLLLGVGSIFF